MNPTEPKASDLTNEELLRAVIEAQVKGEADVDWEVCRLDVVDRKGNLQCVRHANQCMYHILEVLLDTAGCKAAYGKEMKSYGVSFHEPGKGPGKPSDALPATEDSDAYLGPYIPGCDGAWVETPNWLVAAQEIHHAWHSGEGGNNVRAALETAFSFLSDD